MRIRNIQPLWIWTYDGATKDEQNIFYVTAAISADVSARRPFSFLGK